MSRRWIRLNVTWDTSEWLVTLDPLAQLAWVKLLCWVKVHGKGGICRALSPVAAQVKWCVPKQAVTAMLDAAQEGAAVVLHDGEWILPQWHIYQEPDQTATERKRRQRQKHEAVTVGHAVTSVTGGVTRHATTDHRQEQGGDVGKGSSV